MWKKSPLFSTFMKQQKFLKIDMFIFLLLIQKLLIRFPKSQLILKAYLVGKPTTPKTSPNINNKHPKILHKQNCDLLCLVKLCELGQKWAKRNFAIFIYRFQRNLIHWDHCGLLRPKKVRPFLPQLPHCESATFFQLWLFNLFTCVNISK